MFKCECGSEEFYAHTAETMSILYDGNGDELDGGEIMDVERPAWNKAYHCVQCDKAYSDLPPKDPEAEWVEERQRWYLDKKGSQCPFCESDAIEAGSLHADGDIVWQQITCIECDAVWDDVYHLREIDVENYPTDKVPKGIIKPEEVDPNKAFKK